MITIIDKTAEDARRTRIADAIRAKGGTADSLAYPEGFISGINAIEQGGSGKPEQVKKETVISNGKKNIYPDPGYVMSACELDVQVPGKPEQTYTRTYTSNGNYPIAPDPGKVIGGGSIKVDCPKPKPETAPTEIIRANGKQTFSPPAGGVYSNFTADVQVPTGPDISDATATAAEVFSGETAYLADGKKTGTFTIASELSTQQQHIDAIKAALQGKGTGTAVLETLTATENREYTPGPGVDGWNKVLVNVAGSGGGNVAIGRISFPSDRAITQADPLILTHNLGKAPNIMCLFISKSIRRNSGNHDFFAILANQNGSKIGIKGSYMSGNYPEMYLYEAEGQIAGGPHSSGSTFMDVWGATENEIKIGSFKDVSAMLPGNTEYIWLVAKE